MYAQIGYRAFVRPRVIAGHSEPVMHGEVLSSFPVPTFSRHECLEFQRFAGMKQGSIDMCRFRFELFAMT
jgi:hypothetical protein